MRAQKAYSLFCDSSQLQQTDHLKSQNEKFNVRRLKPHEFQRLGESLTHHYLSVGFPSTLARRGLRRLASVSPRLVSAQGDRYCSGIACTQYQRAADT